ncbi:prostate and testis expressed protein 4-like [Gracilinanus agilis]|uniref:prostate and testis expressed protein 4-like n=1 Tax=Gracilinanus agilis TaxID=191870 RepID=UPI001CFD3145|nr:prostate and testis expressed protein 4-like [Gracilinanus agilis]
MDKLLLLGLYVLFLSGDGESGIGALKQYDAMEGLICHVCKTFVNGHCLEGEDTCLMDMISGCEAKVFFKTYNNVWYNTSASLNCNTRCQENNGVVQGRNFKVFCCDTDYCNKPQLGLI